MYHRFLEKCIAWYSCASCTQKEPTDADVIVPISYCATPQGLTRATRENFLLAIRYARQFPRATIAFRNAEFVFPGAAQMESTDKRKMLTEAGIDAERIREAGIITNSVEEARQICARLQDAGIQPRHILLITGAMHAPSARLIWRKVFPKAQILIRCIPYEYETQPDHAIIVLRTYGQWLAANIARHLMLLIFGLSITGRFRHRVSPPRSYPASA